MNIRIKIFLKTMDGIDMIKEGATEKYTSSAHAHEAHYFSGRLLGSCTIYHPLTCRNSMIICTHSGAGNFY